MPEIIVRTGAGDERGEADVLRERVTHDSLASDHYAEQLIERIGWAVMDASESEAPTRHADERTAAAR